MLQQFLSTRRTLLRRSALVAAGFAMVPAVLSLQGTAKTTAFTTDTSVTGPGTTLVLLGTASGPLTSLSRRGISSALVVNGHVYVVDLGHSSFDQFIRAGLDIADVRSVFVTHLHSDHIADLYQLVWLSWAFPLQNPVDFYGPGRAGGLPQPRTPGAVTVINPNNPTPGLADYFECQLESTAYDVNYRIRDEDRPDIRNFFRTHEIGLPDVGAGATGPVAPPMQPFPVMQDDNVQVSAILVDHGMFPSFAFRFETAQGTLVFSGDTAPTPNLITLAQGADILVHEVIDLDYYRAQNLPGDGFAHMSTAHTDVAAVGGVAQAAGVKTLVLTHIAPADPTVVPDHSWQRRAQQGFDGRVVVGHDLERVSVSGSAASTGRGKPTQYA